VGCKIDLWLELPYITLMSHAHLIIPLDNL